MKKLFRNMLATFIAFLFVLSSCVIPMGMLYAEGEGTAKGDFVSCSISLGTDITVNYKVRISDSLVRPDSDGNTENVSVRFTFTGVNTRESEVKGTKLKDAKGSAVADMWLFRFTGVNPQCMGDVLSAQLVVDGAADAKAEDMTVKDYCMELIKGSTDAHLINLVKDLLVYGREAQKYVGYRPGKLVVDNDFAGTTFDALKSDSKYHAKNTLETTKFKSGALYFDNTNKLMFRFVTDSIENLKVTINDKEVTPVADGDTYVVMTDSIAATGFDDIYTVKLILNGETVSTLECSVKAYVYQMQNSSKMRAFANATYAYGLSAKRYVSGTFDENSIVLSFGALSDVHFDVTAFPDATEKLKKAVNQLTKQASKNGGKLDAITFVGDFTNTSGSKELKEFKSVYESVVPAGVKTLLVTGNHETLYSSDAKTLNDFKRIFGDKYFGAGIDTADTNLDIGVRDIIVNGYHFLMLEPTTYSATAGCPYKKEAVEWLDNMLKKLTAENPEQYVFVCTHPMIYNTCYGSDLNGTPSYWSTTDLTPVLDKYSQAVTFSGHLHFPINDNRSIMQGNFTSLGCGSVRYMAIEAGGYEDMYSATQMNDRYDISSGLFVQVDKNGNTRITRMFFSEDDTFDSPWEISYPNAQKTHLEKYSLEARKNANTAPELGEIKLTTGNVKNYCAYATVVFDAAKDDEFAHHYKVTVKNKDTGAIISNKNILSDFYRHAKRSDMKKEYTLSIGTIKSGTYSITVTAYDSWGAKAEKTVDYKVTINADTAGLPAPYVNFEFTDGKIADKMGNVDIITNSGATAGTTDVKFGGKTNKLGALTVPAGKYVVCKFNKLNTADEFRNWAEGCFTVEAFYVNSKNGGIQGVVCGTQDGGWGIAENAGKPYFITGGGSKYNPGAYAGSVSSIKELVHVVGIYDTANKKCTIYINGKKNGEVSIAANFIPGVSGTHNYFCLGDDITTGLVGGDFQTQGMTMVDAKIYDDALTPEQIAKVYAIAENLFATGNDSGEYSTGAGTATCEKVGGTPETPETPDTPEIPEAPEGLYADIDIVDGKVVDKYGNLTLTPNDGKTGTLPTIGTEELTYGGKTKTLPTIKITKMNQYVAAVFGKFATADEFQNFVRKNGLTFEVLYKNDSPVSAVGGIFCSTQYDPSNNKSKGGFGIATQAKSGAPYVIAGANGNAYTSANGNAADYNHGEITHVIGTIDTNGYVTIYVNGKDGVKSDKGGKFNCSKGNMSNMGETLFNTFYIGGDPSADKSGKVSDCPLTSASFIDVKVYSKALTGTEVETAYKNAQTLFETSGAGSEPAPSLSGKTKHPDFADVDFGGREFVFAIQKEGDWDEYSIAPELTGDDNIIDVASANRTKTVETLYNCKIKEIQCDDNATGYSLIYTDILTGKHTVDFAEYQYSLGRANSNLINLGSLDIDLTHDWFDQGFIDTYNVNDDGKNRIFQLSGPWNLISYDATWMLYFNKNVYNSLRANGKTNVDLYQAVRDGKWTVDVMLSMMDAAKNDVNGDQKMSYDDGDVFGLTTYGNGYMNNALWFGVGGRGAVRDATENKVIAISKGNIDVAAVSAAIDNASKLVNNEGYTAINSIAKSSAAVTNGQSLFASLSLLAARFIYDENANFSCIPLPKSSEAQKSYYTMICNRAYALAASAAITDLNNVADFLEVFAFHSQMLVFPEYVNYYKQVFCDEESGEMLDIVFEGRVWDMDYLGGYGITSTVASYISTGKNKFSKAIASKSNVTNAKLDEYRANVKKVADK